MSFKICTVGCGGIATNGHGPSYALYAATHPDTELAACCDLVEERAVRFQERFGFRRRYTDLDRMLDAEKPEAVCLMSPVELTCKLSCHILEKGYPLLLEKPPGTTTGETDRMIRAAGSLPHQVAFNRRHMPLIAKARSLLGGLPGIQHIRYDFTRIGRTDPDFSTTAVHGIDAVRFLSGSDYRHVRFRYQPLPDLGPTVANIFMDCEMESGATAHLNFCPVSGVVVERATLYTHDHILFLNTPMWNGFDAPGRLQHIHQGQVIADIAGTDLSGGEQFEMCGFYAENEAFFEAVRLGRRPEPDLTASRQSVEVAQYMRDRKAEYMNP
ncbi:MAG: Gfo/Idh/MocA family oxidoreductase [Armatimonadetes bacterium]|nr:Gfo/Idh/MocA family oxidoreductase [Armatimonadota bacterium]